MASKIFFSYVRDKKSPGYIDEYQLTLNRISHFPSTQRAQQYESANPLEVEPGKGDELFLERLFGTPTNWNSPLKGNAIKVKEFLDFHYDKFLAVYPEDGLEFIEHAVSLALSFNLYPPQMQLAFDRIKRVVESWEEGKIGETSNHSLTEIASSDSIINPDFQEKVFKALKPYLANPSIESAEALKGILRGEKLEQKIQLKCNGKTIAHFFKELRQKDVILALQKDVISWMIDSFLYYHIRNKTYEALDYDTLRIYMAKEAKAPQKVIPTESIF